jgi:Xaa-Pro aminopeptidase
MSFAGETASSKLDRVRESLSQRRDGPDWIYFLPTLPAIAWLLNIRCPTDIPFCPVPYAYLGLTQDACVLFVDGKKVEDGSEVQNELKEAGVDVRDYGVDEVGKWVKETLGKMKERGNDKKKVIKLWAPNECSWALSKACEDVSGKLLSFSPPGRPC